MQYVVGSPCRSGDANNNEQIQKKNEYKRQIICAPQYQTYRYSEFLSQYLFTFKMHFHRFANYN